MKLKKKINQKLKLIKKHAVGGSLLSSLASAISRGNKDVAQAVVSRVQSGAVKADDLVDLLKTNPKTGSIVIPRTPKYKPAILTQPGTAPTTFNGKPLSQIISPKGTPAKSKFYTEQGSEYVITADGATQRIKSAHANTGGSDIGLHGWSDRAFFTKGQEGETFNMAGMLLKENGIPFTITSKNGKLQYLLYDGQQWRTALMSDVYPKAVQSGMKDIPIVTDFSTTPEIGTHLLEVTTKNNMISGIHPGSAVSYIEKRGKVLKPNQVTEDMFDFEHNWYLGHGTDTSLLQEIQNTGLKNSIHDTQINQFPIANWEAYQNYVRQAQSGSGLHHGARGFSIIEVPKTTGQTRLPKDLYDYLTPEELASNITEGRTPSRFSFFAVDAT